MTDSSGPVVETGRALHIRQATDADVVACDRLDLSYETEYVWQIDVRDEAGAIALSFRTARLPRTLRAVSLNGADTLNEALRRGDTFLVAEENGAVHGYLLMQIDSGRGLAWVSGIGIGRPWRRTGIGTRLLRTTYDLALARHVDRIVVETQTKNYPGICFCLKNGLVFCGFNDRYYANQDVALFFGQAVR
jgi:GNAT superfamily N-acetyltransferase